MMKHAERRTFWRGHVEAWRRSEQSGAAYCRSNHLNYSAFVRWQRRLAAGGATAPAGFVRVVAKRSSAARVAAADATQARIVSGAAVELAGGLRLTLPPMSPGELAGFITSLRGSLA